MGGDHKCPVCGSTFTRSQHVARHMRSHTGDRPYKCVHCGDQFARSDLLSRHVNKCHSIDKKVSNQPNNGRRKQQQQQQRPPSVPSTASHLSQAQLPQTGRPLYAQDPFAAVYQQSPRRYSSDAPDPPSLSSSSVTSMSSASLDSLPQSAPPTEPVFHLPQQHHYQPHPPRQWNGHQPGNGSGMSPFSFLPPNDNGGNMMFKQEPYQPSLHGAGPQHYNDLPTPLAYPGGPFRLDPFIPNHSQNQSGMSMDNGIYMQNPHQQQTMQNGRSMPNNGRGSEFSSAFGLMSLDDAAVLAGLSSDGAPFFENHASSSEGLQNLVPSLAHQQPSSSNGTFSTGMMGLTNPDPNPAQTPNTKEREMRTVREMWAAFLRDPTTGLKPDGTEMGKPEFPIPPSFQQQPHPGQHLHRRSSSYSGGISGLSAAVKGMAQSGGAPYHMGYSQHQQPPSLKSPPHMPTAQHTLHGGTVVVKKLEDQASKIDHENPMAGTPAPAGTGLIATSPDSLRSYEEAILSRKAPVLKLPAKMKTRDSSGSANSIGASGGGGGGGGSNILPSISQSARANAVGGGVASLSIQQQQQLPTAAGASGVPPGSTPNTAFYAQAAMADRPVIAMPKSRSRPTTANGSSSRPNTASGGNSAQGSQPSSRPGTASSTGGGGGGMYSPRHSAHASPHQMPHAHSLPGSRPSTSSAPSPSHSFAFTLPPPPVQTTSYSSFQPGSLPSDSLISPASATSTSHQLVSALTNAGMLDNNGPANNRGRPNYKRLASQVLEPALTKRPHLRRGDTNFNPTMEDQGNDSAMDGFDSEGFSDAGGSERAYGYDHRQYGPGPGGPGFGNDEQGMNAFMSARRMSEPAVAAPRMMMRMPGRGN